MAKNGGSVAYQSAAGGVNINGGVAAPSYNMRCAARCASAAQINAHSIWRNVAAAWMAYRSGMARSWHQSR